MPSGRSSVSMASGHTSSTSRRAAARRRPRSSSLAAKNSSTSSATDAQTTGMGADASAVEVRLAGRADAPALLTLAQAFATSFTVDPERFDRSLDDVLIHHDSLCSSPWTVTQTVGYLAASVHPTLYANGRVAWIEELMVAEPARRRGVARAARRGGRAVGRRQPGPHGQPGDAASSGVLDGRRLRGVGRRTCASCSDAAPTERSTGEAVGGREHGGRRGPRTAVALVADDDELGVAGAPWPTATPRRAGR